MKKPKIPQPNYVRKLQYLYRTGAIPSTVGVHMVSIYHDEWCGVFKDKRCNCNPDIKLKGTVPGNMN